MKILLINPSIARQEVYAKYSVGAPCLPPLGLCYLAAVLSDKGYETRILDCFAENISTSRLKREVVEFSPDLVGVTSTTVSYAAAQEVLVAIKEVDSDIITVLGGAHMSALPVETMSECESIDVGVFGEGEQTLLEIVDHLSRKEALQNVAGTVVRLNGQLQENEARTPVQNLDEFSFPARHLLKDLRLYSHTPFRGAKFTTTMITSRGCPFRCGYCDQSVFGRKWRYHSPEYVVAEMSHLKEKYGIEFISIEDDNFLLSRERTVKICEGMLKANLNLGWSCLGRANEVDDEVLSLMKKAGCRTVYLGIESGSPRILKLINKKLSIEDTRKGIALIKKYGIEVVGSFILGLPTETKEEMQMTIRLALSLPLDGISVFTFTPFPQTPLRELAFQHGTVSKSWTHYSGHPTTLPFIPDGIGQEYLLSEQTRAYRKFLLRPSYLIRHLATFTDPKTFVKGLKFVKALVLK
jgi:anaerobic magnesium-protoporphyrin IX monomethyl ester cyclase